MKPYMINKDSFPFQSRNDSKSGLFSDVGNPLSPTLQKKIQNPHSSAKFSGRDVLDEFTMSNPGTFMIIIITEIKLTFKNASTMVLSKKKLLSVKSCWKQRKQKKGKEIEEEENV